MDKMSRMFRKGRSIYTSPYFRNYGLGSVAPVAGMIAGAIARKWRGKGGVNHQIRSFKRSALKAAGS